MLFTATALTTAIASCCFAVRFYAILAVCVPNFVVNTKIFFSTQVLQVRRSSNLLSSALLACQCDVIADVSKLPGKMMWGKWHCALVSLTAG